MIRRVVFAALTCLLGHACIAADAAEYSAAAYTTCAACHLPDGAGIPGAFPPIRNRAASIEQLDGGREYLAIAVSFGLMGTIDVGGAQYFGVMAGNAGALSAAEIASALNYVLFDLNDDKDSVQARPYSADEVAAIQSGVATPSPQVAADLRKQLLAAAGDQWPR